MLHVLGITHVLSVGECALVPPPLHSTTSAEHSYTYNMSPACQFIPSKGPGGYGSLWIEEREGRINLLDIKGVCDDGIDTLEPQLEPICDWINRARAEGACSLSSGCIEERDCHGELLFFPLLDMFLTDGLVGLPTL